MPQLRLKTTKPGFDPTTNVRQTTIGTALTTGASKSVYFYQKNSIIMKNVSAFIFFTLVSLALSAQTSVKKYVLLEHFTNSKCSVCASKNPAFFTLIDQYPNDVHHVSIHPSTPYSTCVFYQSNTTENEARADFYNIPGTPRVAVNGTLLLRHRYMSSRRS